MPSPDVTLPGPFVTPPSLDLPVVMRWLLTSDEKCGVRARCSERVRSRTGRLQRCYPPFIASPFLLKVNLVPSRCGSRAPKGQRQASPGQVIRASSENHAALGNESVPRLGREHRPLSNRQPAEAETGRGLLRSRQAGDCMDNPTLDRHIDPRQPRAAPSRLRRSAGPGLTWGCPFGRRRRNKSCITSICNLRPFCTAQAEPGTEIK